MNFLKLCGVFLVENADDFLILPHLADVFGTFTSCIINDLLQITERNSKIFRPDNFKKCGETISFKDFPDLNSMSLSLMMN